jgi:succinyl-CoA synthetase beta subunit
MFLPEFRSEEEVWQFVDLSDDSWCLTNGGGIS